MARLLANRYRLTSELGRGGMGTVWRAHDEVLDRAVAVKEVLLPPGLSPEEEDVLYKRTLREARASARLNHPGVVTVHDVVSEDGRPWIIMELVKARSLQDILDDTGLLTPRRTAEIGRQVLAALSHAHQSGILHRDVKPSNVLITADGRAVLTDFGIAQVEGDATLTATGLVMGSPAYIPPERVQGERAVPASDLWALGATLYTALEGRAPYERSDAMAALAAALTEPVPPPRNAGPLREVLDGLLTREPAGRMTAARALPLLTEVANGPEQRRPPNPGPPNPAPEKRVPKPSRPGPVTGDADTILDEPNPGTLETVLDPVSMRQQAPPVPSTQPRVEVRSEPPQSPVDRTLLESPRQEYRPYYQEGWTQPPYTPSQPLPQPHTQGNQQHRTSGRTVAIVLTAAVVIAASLITTALILHNRGGGSGGQNGGPTAAVSPGYQRYTESGFTVDVPQSWQRTATADGIFWTSGDGTMKLQVGQTPWTVSTADDQATSFSATAKSETTRFPNYTEVKIDRGQTYRGVPSADLEFTFSLSGRTYHAVDRFFKIGTKYYAIFFRAPDDTWTSQGKGFGAYFLSVFTPTSG